MPIAPGSRLGPYEVVGAIGAGGMGEVYRARDTKLGRDVALKLLSNTFAADPDRRARFEREAQVLASLNHPHIAHIYGLEESDTGRALVMELVDGVTLADRMARGPLPFAEALAIARQIAEALEAAHDKGIVHRDLKPANVMLAEGGVVKVLDFGLAAVTPGPQTSVDATHSPTLTIAATGAGVILGTAAYMSPEQAAGKATDKRADIWSFSVVLWEMLTGSRLFEGETVSHTLADVLRAPIDFSLLPASTPSAVVDLLRRCLDRNAATRLRDIGEARIAIARYLAQPADATPMAEADSRTPREHSRLTWVLGATAVLALALATAMAFVHFTERSPKAHPVRFQIAPPPQTVS